MITKKQICHLGLLLCWICIIGFAGCIQHNVALAATQNSSGYQIAPVTLSKSTIAYGDSSVTFRAQLTVPANAPVPDATNFYIMVDNQPYQANGSVSGTAPAYSLSASGIGAGTPLAVGAHTVVAEYSGVVTISSQPATLTVTKVTPSFSCLNSQTNSFVPAGVTFILYMQFSTNSNVQVDWKNATYTITFVGAQHTITYANQLIDDYQGVHVSTPVAPDNYTVHCAFNGTNLFNSAAATLAQHIIIHGPNQIGGIKLYTNPTTVQAGQSTTWRVVVTGAPGLPTPTGSVEIIIGNSYLPMEPLNSGGTATFQANAPTPLNGSTISVWYTGDPVYVGNRVDFPLTNPPVPGGSNKPTPGSTQPAGSASTPGVSTTATTAPTGTATAIGTPEVSVTPTTATPLSLIPKNNTGNSMGWIWLGMIIVLAGGGIVGFIALRKRKRVATATITTAGPALITDENATMVEAEKSN